MADLQITHNADERRYEAWDGGKLAGFAAYIPAQDLIVFSHTEVEPAYEGRGVGSALARAGLDDVRRRGLKAMPLCPFVRAWIMRNPEYADLQFNAPPSSVSD